MQKNLKKYEFCDFDVKNQLCGLTKKIFCDIFYGNSGFYLIYYSKKYENTNKIDYRSL